MAKEENVVIKEIKELASDLYKKIIALGHPELIIPLRSLSNVTFNPKVGYLEIGSDKKIRALTVNTVKTFAQTLRMLTLSKNLIETEDISTKREAYYVSKNWGEARFLEQPESDAVMDDIEAMFMVNREQLGFIADEHGGAVAGELKIIDKDPNTGKELKIDCTKFGSGSYSIPPEVEHLKFETDAKFILCIETSGAFERLNRHAYWKTGNCILVSMNGVPARSVRRFVRKLSDEMKLPVYVFSDGDPYGYANIYRTLKVGSGNAAHLNKYFCVPNAKFLGVTPQDIIDYKLPTHPLKDVDVKRAEDAMKNDPFFRHYPEWQKAMKLMLQMKKRAEQQAFAAHGLNYVITDYLPKKLKDPKTWLP